MATSTSRLLAVLGRPAGPDDDGFELFDLLYAAAVVVLAPLVEPGSVTETVPMVVAAAALGSRAFSRRIPIEVVGLVVAVALLAAVGPRGRLELSLFLGPVVVLYGAWTLRDTRRAVAMALVQAAVPLLAATVLAGSDFVSWLPWAAANLLLLLLGVILRRQDQLIEELELARAALAEAAVAAERRRLARELHDLAGHTLAAMLLHVTGARHVLRRDLGDAERALLEAEATGRQGMTSIRAVVAALRTTEHGTDPPLARAADVVDLVDSYRRAGVTIGAELGGLDLLDGGPGAVAVHRIVAESLANATRHAPGNRVEVRIEAEPGPTPAAGQPGAGTVRLTVVDRGQRPASPAGTAGFGLIGMAERARALGGELEAGPTADGWRVAATLPLLTLDLA